MTKAIKTVGILTSGGDCPGLNAVIRAVVKSAVGIYGWNVIGFMDGFRGLVENLVLPLKEQTVSGILTRGGTILGTNNRSNPFAYTYGMDGKNVPPTDRSKEVLLNLRRNEVDALVVIGGDGTLSCAQRLIDLGVPLVAIPKTIDNDLNGTDVTFGFDSALTVATEVVDRLHSTAESHHRVMVVETMGRYAGWIALRSGIAGGGDVILIPEMPYRVQNVVDVIGRRRSRGKEFTIIVVAEGAAAKDGKMAVQRKVHGSHDPVRLGGAAYRIAGAIERKTDSECRVTIIGHVQRGGIPTPFDRWLATRFGETATQILHAGRFGQMTALKGTQVLAVPVSEAVQKLRLVDPQGEEAQTARRTGISFGDE